MLGRLARTQRELRRLATRDPLTDLPNRELIGDRLRKAIARAQRRGVRLAVLFLDLDRFKTINDSLGHDAGDRLLVEVASELARSVRTEDSIGRMGGDEFVVLLEDLHDVQEALGTVQRIVDALAHPFQLDNRQVRATASIGIAVFPDDGEDAATLMRHADLAMYKAKAAGGGCWRFFAREMSERVDARLRTEIALAAALERDELRVVYQAKVAARTGALVGCEALLRWHHEGEQIEAARFIEVAEDTGLVTSIGEWVLDEVCAQIARWCARGIEVPVAVNVSARQLAESTFVNSVLEAVERHAIDARLLSLEITETVLMDNPARSASMLTRLGDRGLRVSIDDFGTGYASLAYLTRLPVQSLQIDRSFVASAERSQPVLETIVAMARALGLETIAEGIETDEERDTLRRVGCDVLQGYRVGLPLDADQFERCHLLMRDRRLAGGSAEPS